MDDNNNFISDYYYVTVKLNVNKDINDHDVPPDGEISMFQTMWYIGNRKKTSMYPIRQSVRTACPCTTGMPLKIQVNIFFSYASYLSNPSSFPQFPGFFPIFNTSSPPAIISL